ncbi:choice-of-anchor tandem repeat GloVer-containing protein [Pollutibacter soli]|uniref:choice-of-anchor tandem repeat GloVer-containing protein n=1 Tax=Pollutibacter soli TaxID=3034157 RepID=UPI003013E93D
MQRLPILILSCLIWPVKMLFAQPVLYGVTQSEGYNNGDIIKVETSTGTITSLYGFPEDILNPATAGGLMQAKDGKLYGMTRNGGKFGVGSIFSWDPVGKIFQKEFEFSPENGVNPVGPLVQARNGLLYGVTQGESGISGVVFSFDPVSHVYNKLHEFSSAFPGVSPVSGLVAAPDGKLYGTTPTQTPVSYGTVYGIDPESGGYYLIFNSTDVDRYSFYSRLTVSSSGGIYGIGRSGIVFSVYQNSIQELYRLQPSEAIDPTSHLIAGPGGILYGSAEGGTSDKGVIFSFDPRSKKYTKLADTAITISFLKKDEMRLVGFKNREDGAEGTIESFDIAHHIFTSNLDLSQTLGKFHCTEILAANDGKWYWTTEAGGIPELGTLYALNPTDGSDELLYDFRNVHGSRPQESLVFGNSGKLYGVTNGGGNNGLGVLFCFDTTLNRYSKLYDFNFSDGANPSGKLVKGQHGKLFGLTGGGGQYGFGTIYSFDPATHIFTRLFDFNGSNGNGPEGSLLITQTDKLIGTTQTGGNLNLGVLFSFDLTDSSYEVLFHFDSHKGQYPVANVIQTSNGRLYGMAAGGANNFGIIYSYDTLTGETSVHYDFDGVNGGNNAGNLFEAKDRNLYGLTRIGGKDNIGVLFSFDPRLNVYTRLYDFRYIYGHYPEGSLTQGNDGKLYGMTRSGGAAAAGVVFSYDIQSKIYSVVGEFDLKNGSYPSSGELIEPAGCGNFSVAAYNSGPVCSGSAITLSVDGRFSYQWEGPGGFLSNEKNPVITNTDTSDAGMYIVTATSEDGCETVDSTRIFVYSLPVDPVIIASGPTKFCEGGEVLLITNSTLNPVWMKDGLLINAGADTIVATVSGYYYLMVTDNNSCRALSDSVQIVVDKNPDTPAIHWDGIWLSTAQGPYQFQWLVDNTEIPSAVAYRYQPIRTGNYSVEIRNQEGCVTRSNQYTLSATSSGSEINIGGAIVRCYPNPASSALYLHNKNLPLKKIRLQMVDGAGRVLLERYFSGTFTTVDVSRMPAGLYTIVLSDDSDRSHLQITIAR